MVQGRGRSAGERTLDTGITEVVTDDGTNDVANPLTAPIRAIELEEVRFDLWMMALTANMQARIGVQFSNDPLDFSSATAHVVASSYKSTPGWNYGTSWYDLSDLGLSDSDYKLYLRFVALCKRTVAGSALESAQLRLRVHQRPVRSRVLSSAMVRVHSLGSTTVASFVPMTDPVRTDDVAVHRVAMEVAANLGVSVQPGWQETDTPDDASSWSSATAIETAVTTDTVSFPGNVAAVSFSKRYARYGVLCKNVSGTPLKSALAQLFVEQRDR